MLLILAVTVPTAVLVTLIAAVAGRPLRAILKHGAIGAAVLAPVFGAIIGGVPTPAFEVPGLVFGIFLGLAVFAAVLITALLVWFLRLLLGRPTEPRRDQPHQVRKQPTAAQDTNQLRLAQLSRQYRGLPLAELERVQREAVLAPDVAALCQRIINEKQGAVFRERPELAESTPRAQSLGPNQYAQRDQEFSPCWAGFGLGLVGAFLTTPLSMFGAAFLGFASPLLSGLLQIALPIGVFALIFIKVCTGAPTRGRRQV